MSQGRTSKQHGHHRLALYFHCLELVKRRKSVINNQRFNSRGPCYYVTTVLPLSSSTLVFTRYLVQHWEHSGLTKEISINLNMLRVNECHDEWYGTYWKISLVLSLNWFIRNETIPAGEYNNLENMQIEKRFRTYVYNQIERIQHI